MTPNSKEYMVVGNYRVAFEPGADDGLTSTVCNAYIRPPFTGADVLFELYSTSDAIMEELVTTQNTTAVRIEVSSEEDSHDQKVEAARMYLTDVLAELTRIDSVPIRMPGSTFDDDGYEIYDNGSEIGYGLER